MTDIDIDVADRELLLMHIKHHRARLASGKLHNTGIYVTPIPHFPVTGDATLDYKEADERGYFKLDILNVSLYKQLRNTQHLDQLLNTEPIWELLEYKEWVDQLFHLSGHHALLKKLKPTSIKQLAAALCIIRPAKRYLADKSWEEIFQEVWKPPETNEYFFKKSHAYAYATAIIVHMNLLTEAAIDETEQCPATV